MAVECINWDAYDVPRIWQMVAGEDDERGWAQVNSWYRLQSAMDAQRERLIACKRSLEHRWPPKNSEAASAFIQYLDGLILSMDETAQAAASTARGLSGIMHALAKAKARVEPIHELWQQASSDWKPELLFGDQEELNREARTVMAETDRAITDYLPMITSPPSYNIQKAPKGRITPVDQLASDSSHSGNVSSAAQSGNSGRDIEKSFDVPPIPHDPPPPIPPLSLPTTASSVGPSLAGTAISPPSAIGTAVPGIEALPSTTQTSGPQFPVGSLGNPAGRLDNGLGRYGSAHSDKTAEATRSRSGGSLGAERVMHSGTRDTVPAGPITGITAGRPANQQRRRSGSSDEAWPIREGVPPVIDTSPHEPDHGPGPGVIGIDR